MITSTAQSVQTARRRPPPESSENQSRDTDILHEFLPIIWRLAEQCSQDSAQVHVLGAALRRQALHLADVHNPALNGPLRPYLLRGLAAFVANHTEGIKPALFDAISQLPYRQRKAFELRYLDRLSIDEIAAAMSIRPASVRSLLSVAVEKLRRKLDARA